MIAGCFAGSIIIYGLAYSASGTHGIQAMLDRFTEIKVRSVYGGFDLMKLFYLLPGLVSNIFTDGEDERRFRIAVAPTPSGGRVMVGVHATRPVRLVQSARWAVGIISGMLSALLALGAWLLTGRATSEIDRNISASMWSANCPDAWT